MKLSSRLMLPMAAIALLGAAAVGAGTVSAATNGRPGSLAQKIASAFNLDPTKVQAVIDQNHDDNQQQREANYEQRLAQAVTDGRLTAVQKQAVLDENAKLKSELEAAKSGTPDQRRSAMKTVRQEAKAWAAQNNIAETWLMVGGPHPRGGMPDGQASTASPSPSPGA